MFTLFKERKKLSNWERHPLRNLSVFVIVLLIAFTSSSLGKPVNSGSEAYTSTKKPQKEIRFRDGTVNRTRTANKSEYYQIDDMLFVRQRNRAGQTKETYRWPNGRVPYAFGPGYSDDEMKQIFYTMKHIEYYTCLRFVFRTESDKDFLYIRNLEGKCQSFVGNVRRGPQQLALDPDSRNCAYPNFPGHVLHELIHAVGFFHEHARDDRDNYIQIMYDNLSDDDDVLRNFYKNSDSERSTEFYGVPYNYGSIMHYSERAGSINGESTITRRNPIPEGVQKPFEGEMGQRERLSEGDVLMMRNMYKETCPEKNVLVSHIQVPEKFPDVLDWVIEHDSGVNIDFPIETISEDDDDDDDEDYDYSLGSEQQKKTRLKSSQIQEIHN